ncbi:MAG: BON domain-containing protein, partial [Opitutales bacterium]|nr:BON domain-containing protein [Opitutales bacterium]
MKIQKYTLGMGDRFAHQGKAQLQAVLNGKQDGIDVYPTWNKSFREHSIVKSQPQDLRTEADAAVSALGWEGNYYVDADHIGVTAQGGVVTLTGHVATYWQKIAAERAVARVNGVRAIAE